MQWIVEASGVQYRSRRDPKGKERDREQGRWRQKRRRRDKEEEEGGGEGREENGKPSVVQDDGGHEGKTKRIRREVFGSVSSERSALPCWALLGNEMAGRAEKARSVYSKGCEGGRIESIEPSRSTTVVFSPGRNLPESRAVSIHLQGRGLIYWHVRDDVEALKVRDGRACSKSPEEQRWREGFEKGTEHVKEALNIDGGLNIQSLIRQDGGARCVDGFGTGTHRNVIINGRHHINAII